MALTTTKSEKPVLISEKLLRWILDEVTRLGKKLDGATNFAINDKQTLSAFPLAGRRASGVGSDLEEPIRMKIKTAADGNGVAVCNTWDGTTAGSEDIAVRMATTKGKVGQELWATRVDPNAGVELDDEDVLYIEIPIGSVTSPTSIAPTGSTADTTTWSIQSDGTPLTLTFMARVAYDTTAHKLYGFNRTIKIGSKGRIYELSAETHVSIEDAEAC
jgi:hypothetical protein